MKNLSRILGVATASALAIAAYSQTAPTLGVGDHAPKLNVFKVIKGHKTELGTGKVCVVEFWATWCGPCKVSIPHITDLAHKYGNKVSFTGVSVSETRGGQNFDGVPAKVSEFVASKGKTMDYNVVMDGPKAEVNKAWMEAAGQGGIPTAFVIDEKGTIAWIGHPMDNMDVVLDKVLAKTWDVKKEAEKSRAAAIAAAEAEKDMRAVSAIVSPAFQSKDTKKMVAALDTAIEKYPKMLPQLGPTKFMILMQAGEAATACKYADATLFKALGDDAMNLNQIAWTLVEKEGIKGVDYNVAVKFAEKAVALSESKEPNILDTLGLSYYRAGNKAKAIETQMKAVELAKNTPSIDITTKKELADRLAMFQKG